jgi:hypothetical protein
MRLRTAARLERYLAQLFEMLVVLSVGRLGGEESGGEKKRVHRSSSRAANSMAARWSPC